MNLIYLSTQLERSSISISTYIQLVLFIVLGRFNMTTVYFIRHAKPNYKNHDDLTRELSPDGIKDRVLVTNFLADKHVDLVFSSPYKRAIDTVKDFADKYNFGITLIDDFRERRVDSTWIEDFDSFCKNQWNDFNYKYCDGECLNEVQTRNISALNSILKEHPNKNIVVGSHGTALSTIINYYEHSFGHADFESIKNLMPWVVKFTFSNLECVSIEKINLFSL